MMVRRAFALIPVLWIVVLLGVLATVQNGASARHLAATRNRMLLTAAEWARDGCLNLIRARLDSLREDGTREYAVRTAMLEGALQVTNLALTGGASCESRVRDLGAQLNANTADSTLLRCVVGSEPAGSQLLAMRPFPTDAALARSLESHREGRELARIVGVRGPNRFNLNSASEHLLACVEGMGKAGASAMLSARRAGRVLSRVEDLADFMSGEEARDYLRALAEVGIAVEARPPALEVLVIGRAGRPSIQASVILTLQVRGLGIEVASVEVEP